jgi:hypothetical protein
MSSNHQWFMKMIRYPIKSWLFTSDTHKSINDIKVKSLWNKSNNETHLTAQLTLTAPNADKDMGQ